MIRFAPTKATRAGLLACAATLLPLMPGKWAPARADTLQEALAQAYKSNPDLLAARAQQRATDENVPIAKASGRPSASVQGSYFDNLFDTTPSYSSPRRGVGFKTGLSTPIYSGGGVKNQVRAAEIRVDAGQADLRGTESSVFSQVVTAYMDVIQNEAIVDLNRKNVSVLDTNLQATSDRFQIGDVTRTDVAQSQSRLALARGDTETAEANLAAARERYVKLVGKAPENLQTPPALQGIPASAQDAVAIALDTNPDLIAARQRIKAADFDEMASHASRLPSVSVDLSDTYYNYLGSLGSLTATPAEQNSHQAQVSVGVSVPLFQGGRPSAQVRQAQARSQAAIDEAIAAERDVIAQVRSAYTSWQAANRLIALNQTAVDAAALSLEGVRAENSVGNRTILDILNAEQEALNAQVQLVIARHNEYVAGFTLLAAMGKAEARDLNLESITLYDPETNYKDVRGQWSDWDDRVMTDASPSSTVDTPVQDGDISKN